MFIGCSVKIGTVKLNWINGIGKPRYACARWPFFPFR